MLRSSLVWALVALPVAPLAAQEAPAEGRQAAQVVDGQLVPADALRDDQLTVIPDIQAHRGTPLDYIRDKRDFVECDLGPVDVDKEVLLVVDGEPVTRNEFRRRAIMYTGMNEIDKAVTAAICESQLARIEAAGGNREDYLVGEAEVDERWQERLEMIRLRYGQMPNAKEGPDGQRPGDWAVEQFLASIQSTGGEEAYRESLRAEASFEKIFLPMPDEPTGEEVWDLANGPVPEDDPKPDWMPQITWDAMSANEVDQGLRYYVKQAAAEGTGIVPLFMGQITSKIRLSVIQHLGLKYFFEADLPDDVFLRVGDRDVKTAELWPLVEGLLVDTDIKIILRELLTLRAVKKELIAMDSWMDDAEFAEAFEAEEAQFIGTLLPLTSVVIFRGYYSVDRYREHFRYIESYRRWKRENMSDDDIEFHYTEGGRMMFERGQVEVDAAWSLLDPKLPYGEENFAQTEAAMQQVLDDSRFRVDTADGGLHYFATRPEMEQFLAGLPEDQRGGAVTSEYPEGDFDALLAAFPPPERADDVKHYWFQRNGLRQILTESELSILLTGYSLADEIVYHALPGDILPMQAMRCRRHYWGGDQLAGVFMVRVKGFSRGRHLPPLQGDKLVQAQIDYLDLNFQYFAQECLEKLLPGVSVEG